MKHLFTAFCFLYFLVSCNAQEGKRYLYKTYFPNGKLKAITTMLDGKKDGKEEIYWENGNPFIIQYFKDDMLVDSFWQFAEHDSGRMVFRGHCYLKSKVELYNMKGQLGGESDYAVQMVADGLVKIYRIEDGGVKGLAEYKNGKQNGIDVLYWLNGNVAKIRHYKNGVMIPPTIEFDSSGNLTKYVDANGVEKRLK